LKASQGSQNEQQRLAEVQALRQVTDNLPPGTDYIVCGDFNIYYSNEPAFQELLNPSNTGYVLDPIDTPGDWHNNNSFAPIHTQSPRTRQFGGGANGGMDDRFDMILVSQSVSDSGGIQYINSSYLSYGNDGFHFNDSINAPPNLAVSQEVADALHYASDHLPVICELEFESLTNIVSDEFNIPDGFKVKQFPNPFNATTNIQITIPTSDIVTISIFNSVGQLIKFEERSITSGIYTYYFDAANFSSGIYLYRVTALAGYSKIGKMILLR
jgi:hypothetical protein